MSAAAEARQSELDRVLDAQTASPELAAELFAVADLLGGQAQLRNAIADLTVDDDRRAGLANAVFSARVSAPTATVVAAAAGLRWNSPAALVAAIDRQGVRALLGHALAAGTLDTVEEELFRFTRTVVADHPLRSALDDRTAPVALRQQLVGDLLDGRADADTAALARRAVARATVSFENTVEDYLALAADVRSRAIATVTVARPLDAEQGARLLAALERQLGRSVNLQVIVDPSVIGGARVQVGDEVIEGTVAGRLAAAEKQLTQ
ncbi:MAG: F0F1 ATP synthase subunit delta [Actinobacteria bacterium]|nr:F0F1 ATP synthase subunit delta [Actinomycetota bacterium]